MTVLWWVGVGSIVVLIALVPVTLVVGALIALLALTEAVRDRRIARSREAEDEPEVDNPRHPW